METYIQATGRAERDMGKESVVSMKVVATKGSGKMIKLLGKECSYSLMVQPFKERSKRMGNSMINRSIASL